VPQGVDGLKLLVKPFTHFGGVQLQISQKLHLFDPEQFGHDGQDGQSNRGVMPGRADLESLRYDF